MDIASGLSALKTAGDLAKALRGAAKAGSLKSDEFAGRIAEDTNMGRGGSGQRRGFA